MLVKTALGRRITGFDKAEKDRQKILDYLTLHGESVLYQIYWGTELPRSKIAQLLLRLEKYGEVERLDGGIGMLGQKCFKWRAKTKKTKSAKEMLSHVSQNLGITNQKFETKVIFGGLIVKS